MSNNEQTPDFPRNLIFHFSKNFGKKSWPKLAVTHSFLSHPHATQRQIPLAVPFKCIHHSSPRLLPSPWRGPPSPRLHWSPASSPVGLFLPFSLSSVFSAAARVMRLLKTPSWLPLSKQTVLSGALDNPRDPCFPPIHTGLLATPPNMPAVLSGEVATPAVCPLCLKTLSPELGVARLLEIFAGLLAGRCGLPCAGG